MTVVVAYCGGPYCVYANDPMRELDRCGDRAQHLEDGYSEWKQAAWPAAVGDGGRRCEKT